MKKLFLLTIIFTFAGLSANADYYYQNNNSSSRISNYGGSYYSSSPNRNTVNYSTNDNGSVIFGSDGSRYVKTGNYIQNTSNRNRTYQTQGNYIYNSNY